MEKASDKLLDKKEGFSDQEYLHHLILFYNKLLQQGEVITTVKEVARKNDIFCLSFSHAHITVYIVSKYYRQVLFICWLAKHQELKKKSFSSKSNISNLRMKIF